MRLKQSRACFTTSRRAVCREPDERIDMSKSPWPHELAEVFKRASDAGWTYTDSGTRMTWLSPDSSHRVLVSRGSMNGRGLTNAIKDFERAGLDLSEVRGSTKPKSQREPEECETHAEAAPKEIRQTSIALHELQHSFNHKFDEALGVYVTAQTEALRAFMNTPGFIDAMLETGGENYKKQLEEAETLYLETQTKLDDMAEKYGRLLADRDRLARLVDDMRTNEAAATERANKAENRLRTLREALGGDL